jgi:hypothetical protein
VIFKHEFQNRHPIQSFVRQGKPQRKNFRLTPPQKTEHDATRSGVMRKLYLLGFFAAAILALAARADIIPSITTATDITPAGAGDFSWNYSATLTQDENVMRHDFFTIYDFAGYMPGGNTQPAGWTFSAALIGTTPGKVTPVDNPNLFNLTWTYIGNTQIGPQSLGIFSAVSNTNLPTSGEFAAEATKNSGDLAGTKIDNIGNVAVPVPEMSALLPMIGVVGFGAIGLARFYLRHRRERSRSGAFRVAD